MQKVIRILQLRIFGDEGDGSTSSREVFHASPFPLPAGERARRTAVTSGLTCSVPFTRSGPVGSLVRTLVASSRWYSPARRLTWDVSPLCSERISLYTVSGRNTSSRPSAVILSVKDIPSSRCLFRLVPLERPIEETECGLLPTVQTQGLKMCDEQGKTTFYPLEMLPTPTARSYKNGSKLEDGRTKRKQEQGWTMELNDLAICGMLPTPTTRDYKSSISPNGMMRKNGKLRNDTLSNIPVMLGEHCTQRPGTTSQLNPLFVEEMMGFPLMWTTLPFLSQNGDRNQLKDMETP